MADTGQGLRAEQLLPHLKNRDAQLIQLQEQLAYFQGWCSQLATAQYSRSLSVPVMQAAVQIVVCGLPEGIILDELAQFFCEVLAANAAAVGPGPPVISCRKLRHQPDTALLQLRCPVEASNCLAFDGIHFKGCPLKVQRPMEYNPEVAVLLGPQQPNPAVYAALALNSPDLQHAAAAAQAATQLQYVGGHCDQQQSGFTHTGHKAVIAAVAGPVTCNSVYPAKSAGSSNWPGSSNSRIAAVGSAVGSGSSSSLAGRNTHRDLAPSADQSKQDEVFIGGLPSHWKAQQVKELLAPYGQLKSLSVAMDAATGKNKGYAFVVFASSAVVSRAIEELDCKVVDGKILAVQRATDGKAACGGGSSSIPRDNTLTASAGGVSSSMTGRDATSSSSSQDLQLHRKPQRSSSGSSSSGGGSSGPLPGPQLAAAAATATVTISHAAGADACCQEGGGAGAAGHDHKQQQQQQSALASRRDASQPAAAAAPDGSSTLGQRLLAAVSGGGVGSVGGAGSKQYDVNELYIGDLPLSWDEDAVRRLLGRYGKIKYFTLRSGRDKNFAFCKFKDASVVDAAIAGLHGKIVDGYFLNVRRAVEGKQQHQQWSSNNKQLNRASYDASKFAQTRLSDQQQQQQRSSSSSRANVLDRRSAPPSAAVRAQQHDEEQQQQQQVKAASSVVSAEAAGEANKQPWQQQQDSAAPVFPPSPPGTPAVPSGQQQQQQQPSVFSAAGPGVQQLVSQFQQLQQQQQQQQPALAPLKHEQQQWQQQPPQQQHVFGPAPRQPQQKQQLQQSLFQPFAPPSFQQQAQQEQQQQGSSLFLSGPASAPAGSWGVPAAVASASALQSTIGNSSTGDLLSGLRAQAAAAAPPQPPPPQQQQQAHSLLQTWDMLSPWSLFSHAQKTPW